MRVRECYLCALIDLGMMHRAIDEAKDTLRLCVVDDLSIRYKLMHLYAYIEDELHAVALHKKYGEKDETQMLLPLAILYYKLGDEEKAEEYIHRLAAKNKDTKEFLTNFANHWEEIMFEHLEGQSLWRYIPFSYSEFMYELNQCRFLFFPVPEFPKWALQHLPKRSRKKKSSKDEENS